jgi:hypothetical protein
MSNREEKLKQEIAEKTGQGQAEAKKTVDPQSAKPPAGATTPDLSADIKGRHFEEDPGRATEARSRSRGVRKSDRSG